MRRRPANSPSYSGPRAQPVATRKLTYSSHLRVADNAASEEQAERSSVGGPVCFQELAAESAAPLAAAIREHLRPIRV